MTPATSFVSKPSSCAIAVVLVDDVVAGAQVGEALQRAAGRGGRRAAARLRKTCVSGSSASPRSRQTKPRRAGETAKSSPARRAAVARLEHRRPRRGAAAPGCAQRLAAVRERDDDVELLRGRSPPSSFSASESPRAAIAGRCASNANGWPCGSGSSSRRAVERELGAELLAPRPRAPRRAPRRGRAARSSGGTRSSGTRHGSSSSRQRRLDAGRARRSAAG